MTYPCFIEIDNHCGPLQNSQKIQVQANLSFAFVSKNEAGPSSSLGHVFLFIDCQ